MIIIYYTILYNGDILNTDIKKQIAINRNLPSNWCEREFKQFPSFEFSGLEAACKVFLHHIKLAENGLNQKFQIVVDSDFDGIASASILYKFLHHYYPDIETTFSIHTGKQHGLSNDIVVDSDATLVWLPDSGTNEINGCKKLQERGVDVICLDHHIIEEENPYAYIVSCMDGIYPNQNLCGAAVTWLFLYGFCFNAAINLDKWSFELIKNLDLVAAATIADIMDVTNDDNMFFIQNGLKNIKSNALKTFLSMNEVNLTDVTIEDIKFKVSPLVSAMFRVGDMPEKKLLFRAFIDDYEEFAYEKRGSFSVDVENIYTRAVRLCKNAKSRQDRAKQKLLEECQVHEYPHVLLVEYKGDKPSTLTGLVANELAGKYSKPCIVYREDNRNNNGKSEVFNTGSIRNYDNSPIESFKELLEASFGEGVNVSGHDNAAGIRLNNMNPDDVADAIAKNIREDVMSKIGVKEFLVDFSIPAERVDAGFINWMHYFEHYTGFGFAPVTALVTGIKVCQENFSVVGKNSFNWKVYDDENNVTYIKFKVDPDNDALMKWQDNFDIGAICYSDDLLEIDAICTFGLNVYKGEIHPQAIVKDYIIKDFYTKTDFDNEDDEDNFDLEF